MVGGPVELPAVAGDDPPRTAVRGAGRRDRVLAVVAVVLVGEQLLAVAEDAAVVVGLGETGRPVDQVDRARRLRRQVGEPDQGQSAGGVGRRLGRGFAGGAAGAAGGVGAVDRDGRAGRVVTRRRTGRR